MTRNAQCLQARMRIGRSTRSIFGRIRRLLKRSRRSVGRSLERGWPPGLVAKRKTSPRRLVLVAKPPQKKGGQWGVPKADTRAEKLAISSWKRAVDGKKALKESPVDCLDRRVRGGKTSKKQSCWGGEVHETAWREESKRELDVNGGYCSDGKETDQERDKGTN